VVCITERTSNTLTTVEFAYGKMNPVYQIRWHRWTVANDSDTMFTTQYPLDAKFPKVDGRSCLDSSPYPARLRRDSSARRLGGEPDTTDDRFGPIGRDATDLGAGQGPDDPADPWPMGPSF
jgi:hypothetical protein